MAYGDKKGTSDAEELKKYVDFEAYFMQYFNSNLKPILEDNRRRYRMKLKDEADREKRGLSTIPSTKSTATVDRAVERAIQEYHSEPDALAFTSQQEGDTELELLARWLTEDFHYRARPGSATFPFTVWHISSLTAAFADGLEAAMVRWHKESYTEEYEETRFVVMMPDGEVPVNEAQAREYRALMGPDAVEERVEKLEREIVTRDTFWIDQLKPGENIIWDFKAAFLDVNLGSMCIVKLNRSMDEMKQLAKGDDPVFDKFDEEKAKRYIRAHADQHIDKTATTGDPEAYTLDEHDKAEVWCCFHKDEGRWMVEFNLDGECPVSSKRSVNDVFFNGRRVDRLPVIIGTHKMKLWEASGRGEPETIGPLEDELINHKNNVSDAAKMELQGRWRLDPEHDISIDDLLNSRVFTAEKGEFERIDQQLNTVDSLRVQDGVSADMAELVPVGMENRHMVPRGTARTLGAVQLALGSQNEKLSVQLIVRNQTFFEPLLYLIAQLLMAYETDETVLRLAGKRAVKGMEQPPPNFPPMTPVNRGPGQLGMAIDHRKLDLDVNVKINAGLGVADKQSKANALVQISEWRKQNGVPTDFDRIARQLNVLAGYDPEAFTPANPPEPPGPEMSGNLNIDIVALNQMLQNPGMLHPVTQKVLEAFIESSKKVTTSVFNSADQQSAGGGSGMSGQDIPMQPAQEGTTDFLDSAGGAEPGGQGGF